MAEVVLISQAQQASQISMVQRIVNEVHRATDDDIDQIKMEMISSMQHYKSHHLWFNEGTHEWTLTPDQQAYGPEDADNEGYPADFISPNNLYVKVSGVRWLKLEQTTIDAMRWLTPTETVVGVPTHWAWWNDQIYFTPIPNQQNHTVRMDYTRDIGIPEYYWNGNGWTFTIPGASAEWVDSWSSDWLSEAEELIRQRTKWGLYFNYYDDNDNAMKMISGVDIAYKKLVKRSTEPKSNIRRQPVNV